MVIAASPAETAALDDFRAYLDEILAGASVKALEELDDAESVPDPEPADCPDVGAKPSCRPAERPLYQPTIRQLPANERPRERLREHGPRYLNNAELVAILLRTGIAGENAISLATRIIAEFEGLGGLARAGYAELCDQRGLSDAKTCEIMAALELGRRIASLAPEERAQISCPQDAANLVSAEMELLAQERLVVLLLNTRNQVVARRTIYIGTVNSSAVRPAEVLRPAIRENAPSIIMVHNHPSGDPTPSPEDVAITRDLVAAGKLMDIELLDHLVIGQAGRFTSLKEKGLGFD
ncbi:MAG: JAB domain-containing protein [Chloroflexi bacterium]|nr:JAB domain-containing protein [Chloroflexota bacterium]MYD49504.1 JAB domain-containing protein [Chloroflexota bacterium]